MKQQLYFFLTSFFLISTTLYSNEPLKLSFHQLEKTEDRLEQFHNSDVSITGFLYKTESGSYVLSATPNLKTCCTGALKNVRSQIYVKGDLPFNPSQRSLSLRGTFKIKPVQDKDGNIVRLYHLKNTVVVQKTTSSVPTSLMTIGAIAISSFLFCLLRKRKELSTST